MTDFEVLQKYDYAKKLALFELDMIKKETENTIEIIGNIHENHELLEKKENE